MTMRSWIANLFASRTPRTIRKAPARYRPRLEALEDRTLLNSYMAATAADLIADIGLANAAGGTNTITLTAPNSSPYRLTVENNTTHGATGLPVIAAGNHLTIVGDGDTIERDSPFTFRLFDVAANAALTLKNLTLQGGLAYGPGVSAEGGAVYSQGALTLDGVTVRNNTAEGTFGDDGEPFVSPPGPGGDAFGGGVYVAGGSLTLTNATLVGNTARGGNGGNGINIQREPFGPYSGDSSDGGSGGNAAGGGVYAAQGAAVALTNATL